MGAGYRAGYLYKVLRQVTREDLSAFASLPTKELRQKLISLSGVGPKVADCVMLFGYNRFDVFPVDTWIQKMYNMSLNDFDLQISDNYITGCSGMGYSYTGKEFIASDAGAPNYEKIGLIEDYELINDDLIIYELPATYWEYFDGEGYYLGDYTLLKNFDGATMNFDLIKLGIAYDETNMDNAREYAYEYLQAHKDEFTLYKHTFKKNDTGYYWYSTEVEG